MGVPVPWVSTMPTVPGSTPAAPNALRYTALCAACEGKVAFAVVQAPTRHVHSEQARRTSGIDGDSGAVHAQGMRNPPGRHAEDVALKAVRPLHGVGLGGHQLIIDMSQSDEHTSQRSGQRVRRDSGMLDDFPGRLQQQPMLRIERHRLSFVDAEEIGVKAGDIIEEGAPLRDRSAVHTRLGIVVVVGVPALGRNFGDQVVAAHERFPQSLRRIDAARKSACHADYRNRCDRGGSRREQMVGRRRLACMTVDGIE
jgi:hypothetical protein